MSQRIMYLRDNNNPQGKGNPIGFLAINIKARADGESFVNYQVSVLHPTDKFDRNLGKMKAISKLTGAPICVGYLSDEDISIHEVSSMVMSHLSTNKKMPKRARQAAQRWLNNSAQLNTNAVMDLAMKCAAPLFNLAGLTRN